PVRRLGAVGQLEHARVGLAGHPLAEVDPDQVLLEDVVVEHVLGGLAQIDDPLTEMRRPRKIDEVLWHSTTCWSDYWTSPRKCPTVLPWRLRQDATIWTPSAAGSSSGRFAMA